MLRSLEIPEEWTHEIVRRKALQDQALITQLSFDEPEWLRTELLNGVRAELPEGYDVEKHFTPTYRPWQQRLAMVPDGDLFKGISSGKASVVTDEIETFNARDSHDVRRTARCRRHHHCDRLRPERARRHRVHRRRPARQLRRHHHVPRDDVHRRAEPRVGLRVLPGELDAARRPDRRLGLSTPPPHGRPRRHKVTPSCDPTTPTWNSAPGSTRRTSTPAT